jgi:dTDP-4-amino-4,6-dideoxygalactose transaminase
MTDTVRLVDLWPQRGSLPETERAAEEVLLLPLYPEMPDADIDRVARSVLEALAVETEVRA